MLALNNDDFSIWEHENRIGKNGELCKGLIVSAKDAVLPLLQQTKIF